MASSSTASGRPFSDAALDALIALKNEPTWMADRRRIAFRAFQELNSAPLDPEEWKRVDLRTFRPEKFAVSFQSLGPVSRSTMFGDSAQFGGACVHVDGACVESRLDPTIAAKGVVFGSIDQLMQSHPGLLESFLATRAVLPETDRFSAWHAAFMTGGTVLYVPAGVTIEQPLHSAILLATNGAADLSHTLVILEEGANATLLEETASASSDVEGLHLGAVELLLGRGARLRYVQLQNWNQKTWHIARQAGRVSSDAFLQWTVGGLGAKLAHIHQDVHLDGRNADAEVNGVSFADSRQMLSYYTQQWHNSPQTHSDLLYKNVLRDAARTVWRGMIKVAPGAVLTDGYQRHDGLLLSNDARADAIPGLEIEADDVKCTHGATAGRVDEEQILYCMSRGLSRHEAMHLIVEGFFQRVFDRIPIEAVRESLSRAVLHKLGLGD